MEKALLWKIEKKEKKRRELEPADTHSAASSSTVFLSHAVAGAGTRMTKANYCCHFIKGIRLARAGKATDWNVQKPLEIGSATTGGRFPLNSNI